MLIGVRGIVALGHHRRRRRGSVAVPNALAAPASLEEAPVEAGSPVTGWAPAVGAGIHPGVVTETAAGARAPPTSCSPGRSGVPRAGSALRRHRGGHGERRLQLATGPLGTEVTIHGSDGRDRTGGMVYSSWVAMQADDETDPDACAYNDFALVELSSGDAAHVNPSTPFGGHGVHDAPEAGSAVLGYWQLDDPARHRGMAPQGRLGEVGQGFGHEVYTLSPGIPAGDGSGYLTDDGEAVGVLTLKSSCRCASIRHDQPGEGPGGTRRARRVRRPGSCQPGTEPFTPNTRRLLPRSR